ncbi:hypothetical protein D3C73_1220610 [compost metagenome]
MVLAAILAHDPLRILECLDALDTSVPLAVGVWAQPIEVGGLVTFAPKHDVDAVPGLRRPGAERLGVHAVERQDLVVVAEISHADQPSAERLPRRDFNDVLEHDCFVFVNLGKSWDVMHSCS